MAPAFAAIGVFLGTIGSTVSFGLATGIGATMLGGALVGAAVGGLTSLVTGGDLGKGLLFGALGGAALGGLSFGPALQSFGGGPGALAMTGSAGGDVASLAAAQAAMAQQGALGAAGIAGTTGLAGGGGGIAKGMVYGSMIEGGFGMAGSMMEGAAAEDRFNQEAALRQSEAAKDRALTKQLAEMNAELQKELKGEDHTMALEEGRNKRFKQELAQRLLEHKDLLGLRTAEMNKPWEEAERMRGISGKALSGVNISSAGGMKEGTKSIYQQVKEKNAGTTAGMTDKDEVIS